MAKRIKAKTKLIPIDTWSQADDILKQVGHYQCQIAELERYAQEEIDTIKADVKAAVEPIQECIQLQLDSLQAFAEAHRLDFNGAKSRKLNFGVVGWRLSTSITINAKKTLELIKTTFSRKKAGELLIVKESVSKEALAKLTDEDLASVAARRITKDAFFVEPDSVTIAKTV